MINANLILDSVQVNNLHELFMDDVESFIQGCLNEFECKNNALVIAIECHDHENIVMISHALKQHCFNIGACALANAFYNLEVAACHDNYDEVIREYHSIQSLYPQTKAAVLKAFY